MEVGEIGQARLLVLGVVLVGAAFWMWGRASDRRRQERFATLARALGSEVVREGEHLSRFSTEVEGRSFEVCLRHIGRRGWYLVTRSVLRGVSELHSVEIRRRGWRRAEVERVDRDAAAFEEGFRVLDAGYPPRPGWLDERVRGAIAELFALDMPLESLGIEEGRLVHRMSAELRRLDPKVLSELLARQRAVAVALERSL